MGEDMAGEKTLLQQIREKELEINIQIENSRKEAEEILLDARKKASDMVETSEREGESAARIYQEREMERIKKETDELRLQGERQATAVREEGERNISVAIGKIVQSVSME
jgi:vacuolar-type H+-ATPase subunit H